MGLSLPDVGRRSGIVSVALPRGEKPRWRSGEDTTLRPWVVLQLALIDSEAPCDHHINQGGPVELREFVIFGRRRGDG